MQAIVTTERSSHWYTRDGHPDYERECKTRPGKMRPTNLRDARADQLLPSVTTITQVIAKPQLERWKIEQGILAALTLPRLQGEGEDAYAKRVADDAQSVSREAAALGTDFHRYAMQYLHGGLIPANDGSVPMDPRIPAMVGGFAVWSRKHLLGVIETESAFGAYGYGGKYDLLARTQDSRTVLADIKTQTTRQGKKISVYLEYGMQLAAYAHGTRQPEDVLLWNIIVSASEMGRVEIHDWTADRREMRATFLLAMELWCKLNAYDPRKVVMDNGSENELFADLQADS